MGFISSRSASACVLAIAVALAACRLAAQEPPTLAAAAARLQAHDAGGAASILERLTALEPENGRAWRNLAAAYRQLKNFDAAARAYKQSLTVEPGMPAPLFGLAVVAAAGGDRDAAFVWLEKARATRKIDMTEIDVTPEFEPFRADPRFAKLRPSPGDFRDPFVEPVRIVREWDGEGANDQFGWIARNIGDVDGDGVPDVVTSAPTRNVKGDSAGRIYVYSTKSGRLLWSANGAPGDELGTGVEAAGDTNADGIPDVVASAPGGGYARIYSGRNGRVLVTVRGEAKSDEFGRHASGVGDVNRDGFADIIVGAPGNNANGTGAGRAYVYSGKDGQVLLTLTGERAGDAFGSAVTGYSDRTRTLLVVGAPSAGPDATAARMCTTA